MAENSVDSENYEKTIQIPSSVVKGGCYEVKIENLYDPSKFWVIVKFRELSVFMQYLKHFYDITKNRKIILKRNLKRNMMCIVQRNDLYYRCVVLPVLLLNRNQIRVFMVDFGYIVNVNVANIFYIHEKHKDVPRFAIRASLSNISPVVPAKTWSLTDLKLFCEIIQKRRIFANVSEIDTERKILFVEIFVSSKSTNESVNNKLVLLKFATYNKISTNNDSQTSKYINKVRYPHLFPSFEALESGTVPSSLWEKDLLKHSVPMDLLYSDYYQYQDINS